jgi:hypothetical protein
MYWQVIDTVEKYLVASYNDYYAAIALVDELNEDANNYHRFRCTHREDVANILLGREPEL